MLIWQKYLKVLGQVSSTLPSSTSKYQVLLNFKVSSTSKHQVLEILHQVPSTSTLLDPNPDIDLFWPYLDPENLAHGGHFSHMKTFWENGQKLSKFQIFTYIFVIKDPLKLEAKNKNSSSTSFGAILLCTFTPNIGMIRWKLREPIGFEKKSWWTPEGSVSDKLRWPGQKLGWKGA